MRRSQALALFTAFLVVVGVGVAVARLRRDDPPRALPSASPSAATTPSASASSTPTPRPKPTPVGKGPRDREYDVVFAEGVTVEDAAFAVAEAGGEILRDVAKLGVATVRAGRDFVARARTDTRIHGVVTNRAVGLPPAPDPEGGPAGRGWNTTRTDSGNDPLADLQWDMDMINAPRARRVESGDPRVLVAVIDTGVDRTHPDLVKAYDVELSRNFVTDYPGADGPCEEADCTDPVGIDEAGHGTHVAGTIVAAADGFGMAGIAPGVRLVDLRAGQDSGLFFLLPTVRALVYAADIGVDVANMSYFVDPWLFNCPNGPDDSPTERYEQRALIEGVRRAVEYAHSKGVTLVAAAGNEHLDLDEPRVDVISPDFPQGAARTRRVDRSCEVLPTTLDHVLEVSALARDRVKADYSDYGLDHIALTAPGGSGSLSDGREGGTELRTLSTYPEALLREQGEIDAEGRPASSNVVRYCSDDTCGYYTFLTGTSMASPHVAGVAALVVSKYGRPDPARPGTLRMDPAAVARVLTRTAMEMRCPDPPRVTYPARSREYAATCRTRGARTSFYGAGMVDALAAVSD